MEWLNEIIAANAKQLPVVGLLGGMCTVLWKAWMKERKDNKALYEARIKDLKTMLKPDDSSDS